MTRPPAAATSFSRANLLATGTLRAQCSSRRSTPDRRRSFPDFHRPNPRKRRACTCRPDLRGQERSSRLCPQPLPARGPKRPVAIGSGGVSKWRKPSQGGGHDASTSASDMRKTPKPRGDLLPASGYIFHRNLLVVNVPAIAGRAAIFVDPAWSSSNGSGCAMIAVVAQIKDLDGDVQEIGTGAQNEILITFALAPCHGLQRVGFAMRSAPGRADRPASDRCPTTSCSTATMRSSSFCVASMTAAMQDIGLAALSRCPRWALTAMLMASSIFMRSPFRWNGRPGGQMPCG